MTSKKPKKVLLTLIIITEILLMVLVGKLILDKINNDSFISRQAELRNAEDETYLTTTKPNVVTSDFFTQTSPYVTTEFEPLVIDYELERTGYMLKTDIERQEIKPYTVMIYMNGSNLETYGGAATIDILEMLNSGYDSSIMNVLIFTGGTEKWQNYGIPSENCCIYLLENGGLTQLANVGKDKILEPDTLTKFINFGMELFPAQRCGLILWNHGGGAVEGYGYDELNPNAVLTITEIKTALSQSSASKRKLEFFGFDACLMATLETAEAVSDYAKYFIASEEVEPADGWDYVFLGKITESEEMNGDEIGIHIIDTFTAFYRSGHAFSQTTLSVIDLGRVEETMTVLNNLSYVVSMDILNGDYDLIAKFRNKTKAFGTDPEPEYNTDMIDLMHFSEKLSSTYPDQCAELNEAINNLVIYNSTQGLSNANGISVYFPYSSTESVARRIKTYNSFDFAPQYKQMIIDFSSVLTGENLDTYNFSDLSPVELPEGEIEIYFSNQQMRRIADIYFTLWQQCEDDDDYYIRLARNSDVVIEGNGRVSTTFNGVWKSIQNQWICLYEIETTDEYRKFSCPVLLNGDPYNIIIIFSNKYKDGKILGCSPAGENATNMSDKKLTQLKKGDAIQFEYYAELFLSMEELQTDTRPATKTVYSKKIYLTSDEPQIKDINVSKGVYLYGFEVYDTQNKQHFTDFIRVDY